MTSVYILMYCKYDSQSDSGWYFPLIWLWENNLRHLCAHVAAGYIQYNAVLLQNRYKG